MDIISLLNNMPAAVVSRYLHFAIQYALLATLLCEINGKWLAWWRGGLFAALMLATIAVPERLYYELVFSSDGLWSNWGWALMEGMVVYRNPIWLMVCATMAVFVLGLSWQSVKRQLIAIFCGFQMLVCVRNLILFVAFRVQEPFVSMYDPTTILARYIFLVVLAEDLAGTLIVAAACGALRRYIHANQNKVKVFAERDGGRQASAKWICAQILLMWLISLGFGMIDEAVQDSVMNTVQLGCILAMMLINVLAIYLDYALKIKDFEARNHAESARLMRETIDGFRGVKHDFNNILQTYDGYFALEDYQGLKAFHAVLRNKTVAAGDRLQFQASFQDRPALLGLIAAVSDYAEASGVRFSLLHEDLLSDVAIPDFDLCRVLRILLDNAIEHAANTRDKTVSLSIQSQPAAKGIVIIANSVDGKINTAELFRDGYTTKSGHAGHGLAEVNKILAGHYGCTIMPSCMKGIFTMYLNVPLSQSVG